MTTVKQYKYVLVIIDSFTEFTWIFPTKTTTAKETMSKSEIVQTIFGNPSRIISDRGAAFSSGDFAEFCKKENMQHHMVTTGVLRGNSQVERVNRCIIPLLTKTCLDDPTKWYKYVPTIQRALNSTYHRGISMTPFRLLFGVEMKRKDDVRVAEHLEKEFIEQFTEEKEENRPSSDQVPVQTGPEFHAKTNMFEQ